MKVIRTIISVLLAAVLLGALSSCTGGSGNPSSPTNKEEQTTAPADAQALAACRSAYKAFLEDYIEENIEIENDEGAFALVRIDGDDIPELVVCPSSYHTSQAELYAYVGGEVKKVGEYGQEGSFYYIPGEGIIVSEYSAFGDIERGVYKLAGGEATLLHSYFECPEDPLDETSDKREYYIDDKEVSQEAYEASYSKDVPSETICAPDFSSSVVPTYELTAEDIENCFGSGVSSTGRDIQNPEFLYSLIVKNYGKNRQSLMYNLGYDIPIPEYEYAIKDINSDGVKELVIREEGIDGSDGDIGAIYTLNDGRPVELFFMGRSGSYRISANGYLVYKFSIEKIEGAELVPVATEENPGYSPYSDDEEDQLKYEAFLTSHGVSLEDMEFDYIPYEKK